MQSRDSACPRWGCHRSDPTQGQDVGLWPEQASPRGVRIRPGGLCLSWGWTCRHCQGLGDRRAGANVLSIWFQLLVAELLVASLPHLGLSVRCFHSPAPVWPLPGQGAGLAPAACSDSCAALPAAARPGTGLEPPVWSCLHRAQPGRAPALRLEPAWTEQLLGHPHLSGLLEAPGRAGLLLLRGQGTRGTAGL